MAPQAQLIEKYGDSARDLTSHEHQERIGLSPKVGKGSPDILRLSETLQGLLPSLSPVRMPALDVQGENVRFSQRQVG
jgi:hypothetical protein